MRKKEDVSAERSGYLGLRDAIVLCAIKDYQVALKRIAQGKGNKTVKSEQCTWAELAQDCEDFFMGEDFSKLQFDIDGTYLLAEIKKNEQRKELKRKQKKSGTGHTHGTKS